jgi:hypothetical protein
MTTLMQFIPKAPVQAKDWSEHAIWVQQNCATLTAMPAAWKSAAASRVVNGLAPNNYALPENRLLQAKKPRFTGFFFALANQPSDKYLTQCKKERN